MATLYSLAGYPDSGRIAMLQPDPPVSRLPALPLLSSAQSGWNDIQLERYRLPPVDEFTSTVDGYQICLNLSNPVTMTWKLAGRIMRRTMQPGELCTATHGEFRMVSWSSSFETLLFSISPKAMSRVSLECGRGQTLELVKHRGVRDAQIETILHLLHADLAAGCPAGAVYGEQLGSALAVYLYKHKRFAVAPPSRTTCRSALPGHTLNRVLEYIEQNLGRQVALDELAHLASISRFYFSKLFRNSTGQSPCRYIVERKVERAKYLLAKKNDSLSGVAQALGFSSHSHFTTVFCSRTGVTPANYRRSFSNAS